MRWGWSLGFGFSQILFVIVCHSLPFSLSVPNYNRLKITTDFHFCIWGAGVPWKSRKEYFPNIVWTLDNTSTFSFLNQCLYSITQLSLSCLRSRSTLKEHWKWARVSTQQEGGTAEGLNPRVTKGDLLHNLPIVFGKQISCYRPVFYFCLMVILSLSLWLFMRWLVDYGVKPQFTKGLSR